MQGGMMVRDPYVDCLRGVAIFLVVFGHLIEPLIDDQLTRHIYLLIYLVHIPMLAFLSGSLSKDALRATDYESIARNIFVPLIVFNAAYKFFVIYYPSSYNYGPLTPHTILWFLLALIYWRLFGPLFHSFTGLLLSVFIAVAVGYFPSIGYDLSLARSAYFFPFFVLGSLYGRPLLELVRSHRRHFAALFPVFGMVGVLCIQNGLHQHALYGVFPYVGNGVAWSAYPWLGRLLILALSTALSLCTFALVPSGSRILGQMGRNSISIYLFHYFFVLVLKDQLWRYIAAPTNRLLAIFLLSLLLCFALSFLRPLIDASVEQISKPFRKLNIWLGPK